MAIAPSTSDKFVLKDHLINHGFTEYDKLAKAFETKELTLQDILDCTESDLKDLLTDYGVKIVQRNRFINAIKKLDKSRMNMKVTDGNSKELVVLNKEQQSQLQQFIRVSEFCRKTTTQFENLRVKNQATIEKAKEKLETVYTQALEKVCNIYFTFYKINSSVMSI